MQTSVLPFSDESIAEAARLILAGEAVAVPTETVYGLAADATNGEAVAKIYEAKRRPTFNPLIVHVSNFELAERIGHFDNQARDLALEHWPGPLTLVVPLRDGSNIASIVTAGLRTVGVRVPAHPAIQALLRSTGRPLAAPSANASGSLSPTRAEHVRKSLGDRIRLIIDAGPTQRGLESTIVAATGDTLRLLRPGPVQVNARPSVAARTEAPGQLASHYAPSKPLRLNVTHRQPDEFLIGFAKVEGDATLSSSGDLVEAAAHLFDRLHEADASLLPRIGVAPVPNGGLGAAINDRLTRASAQR